MAGNAWLGLLEELARITGSEECLKYDACPHGGLVFNIDGYAASYSKLPWMSWEDFGWKSVIAAAADVIASGGLPRVVLYSVGVTSADEARRIARGVGKAARRIGAVVLKADTNRAKEDPWIDVAVVGEAEKPVGRRGARPSSYLVQAGIVGPGLVTEWVLSGRIPESEASSILELTRRPFVDPRLGGLISRCNAYAASDNSDGWAFTISTLLGSSLDAQLYSVESSSEVLGLIARYHSNPQLALFESKEDYSIAIIANKDGAECIVKGCREIGTRCNIVGRVVEGNGRIYYRGVKVEQDGWKWF